MDDGVYERIVMEQKDRLFGYSAMMLRDTAEAQDVAQEALVRLWQNRARVEPEGAHLWLRRTAHNLCIDRIRRRKTRKEVEEEPDTRHDHKPGPGQLAESSELGRLIEENLIEMGETDRAVILMREVQGMAYEEIAQALDMPLGTLKARLHRARHALRARLVRAGVTR